VATGWLGVMQELTEVRVAPVAAMVEEATEAAQRVEIEVLMPWPIAEATPAPFCPPP